MNGTDHLQSIALLALLLLGGAVISSCSLAGGAELTGTVEPVSAVARDDGYGTVLTVTLKVANTSYGSIYRSTASVQFETDRNSYAVTVVSDAVIPPGASIFISKEIVFHAPDEEAPALSGITVSDAFFL